MAKWGMLLGLQTGLWLRSYGTGRGQPLFYTSLVFPIHDTLQVTQDSLKLLRKADTLTQIPKLF